MKCQKQLAKTERIWKSRILTAIGILLICTSALADVRPLKLVTYSGAFVLGEEALRGMQEMCAMGKGGRSAGYPAFLTDAFLRKHVGMRVTKWYDGDKAAVFTKTTAYHVDMGGGCAITAYYSYSASVQIDCVSRFSANSSPEKGILYSAPEKGKNACFDGRDKKTFVETYKKVTLEDGTPCLLNPATHANKGIKHCLYPRAPYYMGHPGRPVDFLVGHNEQDEKRTYWHVMEELRDGDIKVNSNTFTEQAVREWVNQPTTEVLK